MYGLMAKSSVPTLNILGLLIRLTKWHFWTGSWIWHPLTTLTWKEVINCYYTQLKDLLWEDFESSIFNYQIRITVVDFTVLKGMQAFTSCRKSPTVREEAARSFFLRLVHAVINYVGFRHCQKPLGRHSIVQLWSSKY